MPKRDEAHMEGQRERIMRAALFCIAEKGVERTSVSDIWKKAGLSAGALYVHFKNKDELIAATIARFSASDDIPQPRSWDEFKALVLTPLRLGEDPAYQGIDPARLRLYLLADSVRSDTLRAVRKPPFEAELKIVALMLKALEASNAIELRLAATETAEAMAAYVDGMWLQGLELDRPATKTAKLIDRGLDLFVKGLK